MTNKYRGHRVYGLGDTGSGTAPVCVSVQLHTSLTTPDVWWSSFWQGDGNSYVLAGDPSSPRLYSVNVIGEIRWLVRRTELDHALEAEALGKLTNGTTKEGLLAARHFDLDDVDPWPGEARSVKQGKDGFAISERFVWRPGVYASEEAAQLAFDFDDAILQRLQDASGGVITLGMLQKSTALFLSV